MRVLPHGTTAIFADPHEIANVFGLEGVRMMAAEAAAMPIHVFVQVPSCRALGARPGDSGSPHHAARSGTGADLAPASSAWAR